LFKVLAEHYADGCVEMHTISNVAKDMDRIRSTLRALFGIGDLPFKYDMKAQVYRMGLRLADRRHDQRNTDAADA
jgi:hypothetical protein